jgi:pantothenate kinase
VAPLLDESWYLQADAATRQERLTSRHQRHGLSREQASTWALTTDQDNAAVVARSRARADLVVTVAAS